MEKLMTLWDFDVMYTGSNSFLITLYEVNGPRMKNWPMAHGSYDGYIAHMNTLTDELCEAFFPKPKLSKEQRKALKAIKTE